MLKKFLVLGLLALGAITLTACVPESGPTVEELLDQITEAMNELDLPSTTTTDLTLPNSGLHDVVITWSSSDTDFIADDGTVTLPTKTEGDQTVTMTASLELEGQTLVATFDVTVTAATDYTDAELLAQAVAALVLPVTGIVTSSFTLPTAGANGTTIAWSSSNTAVVGNDGTVTRPANGEGNAAVTLTATVTLNAESATKEIEVIVAEEDPSNTFASVAALLDSTLGDIIEFEGEVSGLFDGGYFLTDGTDVIGVYAPASSIDPAIGDTVYVKGAFAKYNTLFQFGDVQEEEITATGDGTQPLTPIEITIADLLALDSSDPLIHGKIYTITGMVDLQGEYDNIYLVDGDDQVLIYYYSLADSLAALEAKEGLTVTIDVIYYTDHSSNGVMMAFQGLDADIEVVELGDQDAFDADVVTVEATYMYSMGDNFTLPAEGANGTLFTAWTSSDASIVADDGTWVAAPGTTTEITFTGTATLGSITDTVTFTVDALAMMTVADAVGLDDDKGAYVQGVVVATLESGYFISDGTGYIGMYNPDHTVSLGDELTIFGGVSSYYTLKQFGTSAVVTTVSTGNTVDEPATVISIADLLALDFTDNSLMGGFYTITGTPELRGDYDNVYIVDGDDAVLVYYNSLADSIAALEAKVGTEITITVFLYTNHSRDGLIVGYQDGEDGIFVDTMTEAEKLAADIAALEAGFPEVAVADIMLPADGANGTTFTAWASDMTGVFGNDGVFVARDTTTVTVTFTATATNGAETETVTLEVVVPVVNTIGEVLALEGGSYFELNGTVTLEGYYGFFIWDGTDNMFVYENGLFDDIKPGDDINIIGWLGSYNGLIQANVVDYTITVADNALPTPIMGTVEGIEQRLYQDGQPVTVTTLLTREGDYNNVYLNGVAGGHVEVYYHSNDEALVPSENATVTITVYPYGNGRVLYYGEEADVVVDADGYTDAEKAQAIADGLDLGNLDAVVANLTLPTTFADPVATIAWATTDAAVVTDAGVITFAYGSQATATLTATVTVGVETATKDFMVTLADGNDLTPLSVEEAKLETDGDIVLVTAVVSGFDTYGNLYLQNPVNGEAMSVYDPDFTVAVGDLVVVNGELATYSSYGNDKRQLTNASLVEITSSGNAVFIRTDVDAATLGVLATIGTYQSGRFTMDLTISDTDDYGDILFVGDGTTFLKFSRDFMPYIDALYIAGDTITFTFTVRDINYDDVRLDNVIVPALTDAEKLLAAEALLSLDASYTTDITLPADMTDYDATITWSSDTPAVISDAGVVVQPAIGDPDATVVLTATITVGSETPVTKDFTITVPALVAPATPDLFFSEYAEADGGNCKYVEIYNPTDATVDLSLYKVVKGGNGTAYADSTDIYTLTGTLAPGAVIVLGNSGCVDAGDQAQDPLVSTTLFPTTGITWEVTTVVGYVNGDDALGLFKNDVLIDTIGENGIDPGSYWGVGNGNTTDGESRNCILVRVSSVTAGETDWAVGATQWVVQADDRDYSTVGTHTVD